MAPRRRLWPYTVAIALAALAAILYLPGTAPSTDPILCAHGNWLWSSVCCSLCAWRPDRLGFRPRSASPPWRWTARFRARRAARASPTRRSWSVLPSRSHAGAQVVSGASHLVLGFRRGAPVHADRGPHANPTGSSSSLSVFAFGRQGACGTSPPRFRRERRSIPRAPSGPESAALSLPLAPIGPAGRWRLGDRLRRPARLLC